MTNIMMKIITMMIIMTMKINMTTKKNMTRIPTNHTDKDACVL